MIDRTVLPAIIAAVSVLVGALIGALLRPLIDDRLERQRKRARINVKISLGSFFQRLAGSSEPMVILSASNPGSKAITLSSWGLALPNRKHLGFPNPLGSDVQFPHELAPETSCSVWVEAKEIARAMKTEGYSDKAKVVGFYRDQVGRTYKSKPFEFDVEDWPKD